ncbi:MAG: M16 family metallopeptidase [Terriglobia bacterium]
MKLRLIPLTTLLACCGILVSGLVARESPPVVPAPRPVTIPMPTVRTLGNGLTVVALESEAIPAVTLTLALRTGAEADPPSIPGTAEFVASLLNEGTTTRSAQQIAAAVDGMGAVFDSAADWDDSWASLSVLSDHTELGFDLLSDMVINPAFAPTEIARLRRQTLSALAVLRRDPSYLADTLLEREIFWGTPYSHPANGVEGSVRRLTRQELEHFHDLYYQPANAILVVVGNIDNRRALDLAQRYFGGWKDGGELPSAPAQPVNAPQLRRVVVIDDPDAVQTEIRVANSAVLRASPEYNALALANQVLGGPAEDRLFSVLRTRRGLVYGASSSLVCYRTAGAWEITTSTRTTETRKTLDLILSQMKRLDSQPIRPEELSNAQDYLVGKMALDFETSSQIAEHVLDLIIYNLPLDTWNEKAQKVRSLTRDSVWKATREHLDPASAVIVLVGNAAEFQRDLKGLGPVQSVPMADVDLASSTLERPARTTGPAAGGKARPRSRSKHHAVI